MSRFIRAFFWVTFALGANLSKSESAVIMLETRVDGVFTVSSTDILNGIAPTSTSGLSNFEEGMSYNNTGNNLTNGNFGAVGAGPNELTVVRANARLVYNITSTDIYEIATYSGWRDSGRSKQDYVVSVSSNGGNTWNLLYTVNSQSGSESQLVRILDDGGAPLAMNINAIKFDFPTPQNGYVGYREIDVFGPAIPSAVPEPNTMAIGMILSVCGFIGKRRMLRKPL